MSLPKNMFAFLLVLLYFQKTFCCDENCVAAIVNASITEAEAYQLNEHATRYMPKSRSTEELGTFDFIIVGAGATGSVIANRLSEIFTWKVLLIEAGEYGNNMTNIPGLAFASLSSDYNWNFNTISQQNACLGTVDQKCTYPRGRGVGGSTLINGNMVSRGSPKDYDRWADLGNPGWSYKEVLPYFLKSENFLYSDFSAPVNWWYHNMAGLHHVEFTAIKNSRTKAFQDAHLELGYKLVDYNGPTDIGVSPIQLNSRYGRRVDTGTSFIKPFTFRTNLKVLTNSFVTKIDINNATASGVYFSLNNKIYHATASKEVIISGGTIQTPQLLMLSGIGPKEDLEKNNIEVVQDLAVGKVFRDHTFVSLYITHNATDDINISLQNCISQFMIGKGSLTGGGPPTHLSFFKTNLTEEADYPDIEYILNALENSVTDVFNKVVKFTDETLTAMASNLVDKQYFLLFLIHLHTQSVGSLKLKSNSPFEYPLIDPNFYSDTIDIEKMYQGILQLEKLLNTTAFRKINATLNVPDLVACNSFEKKSKDYWICYIKQITLSFYHPVGTCPMGPDPSVGAVVDTNLKVYGINNLRVADASIFPFTFTNHPVASCIMIGEKISDVIKYNYILGKW